MKMREHKTLIFQHRNEKLFAHMRYFDELDGQIVHRSRKFDISFLGKKNRRQNFNYRLQLFGN